MGYSSIKNFSPLTDTIGLSIDGCGNTYEKKYYVNGTYIDLCGLTIEEYMNNPCCGSSGNGGSDNDSKPINEIFVKTFTNEEGLIYYQAFAKFAVTSNIKVKVYTDDDVFTELDLYAGDTESKPEAGESLEIFSISLTTEEDDDFKYIPVTKENTTMHTIYISAIKLANIEGTIEDFTKIEMQQGTTSDITFIIPGTTINYNEMENIEEFEKFCLENQYCLALCLPKRIYDKKNYSISNYGGSDVTNNFIFDENIIIDDIEYTFLIEKAVEDIMPFVPLYNEDIIYEYKLTLNK